MSNSASTRFRDWRRGNGRTASLAVNIAVEELKVEGTLRRRCRLRQCKYLNNVVEQDHRVSKKASLAGERLPLLCDGVADITGNRGVAHDSEGASQMGGQR